MTGPASKAMPTQTLQREAAGRWGAAVRISHPADGALEISANPEVLSEVCGWLFHERRYALATVVAQERSRAWRLLYLFWGGSPAWVRVRIEIPLDGTSLPTIADRVHAADWHEREIEDLFGLSFVGHPRLGDFVLHEEWAEGTNPMRQSFDASRPPAAGSSAEPRWRPGRVVRAAGAFMMPVGPVFSGAAQASHFLLETIGEEVLRTIPRLFYKYRGVEKLVEGHTTDRAVLVAERFTGASAVAHAWAFCRAVETIAGVTVPPRAELLRAAFAELERFRHHLAAIAGIVHSTGMTVASSQADLLVEEALRSAGAAVGHRYLFGQVVPGGMYRDWRKDQLDELSRTVGSLARRLDKLARMFRFSSSFLDRLEQVGIVGRGQAEDFGLVGPVARGSGVEADLRTMLPYGSYRELLVEGHVEQEGDGYARLRVLLAEAQESARLIRKAIARLEPGPVRVEVPAVPGEAVGWCEAPRGATFHWVRLDGDGHVARCRLTTPSFINWHGFHLAAERFAFQDFPIIMATFGLSTAEGDR